MDDLTVSQVNEYANALLSRDPILRNVRVQGEISGFKKHGSGHMYFSLKDENALIRAVMFRQNAFGLDFVPKDGMQVAVEGNVAIYTRDGQYQLYAKHISRLGQGELYRRFMELKKTLEIEGYFEEAHKKEIPFLPQGIGIVTSGDGAALQDMLKIIRRRFPGMNIVVYPAQVQGSGAEKTIADGIATLNKRNDISVIIVGRGGGSIEELWAFNTKAVADAIYQSDIPIISAVGHETDYTISDFVADMRAPTPSAAAVLSVPEYAPLMQRMDDLYTSRLYSLLTQSLSRRKERLGLLLQTRGFLHVEHRIAQKKDILENGLRRMDERTAFRLRTSKEHLSKIYATLQTLAPHNMLARGFAYIETQNHTLIRTSAQLEEGMRVLIRLSDGQATANIEQVEHSPEREDMNGKRRNV